MSQRSDNYRGGSGLSDLSLLSIIVLLQALLLIRIGDFTCHLSKSILITAFDPPSFILAHFFNFKIHFIMLNLGHIDVGITVELADGWFHKCWSDTNVALKDWRVATGATCIINFVDVKVLVFQIWWWLWGCIGCWQFRIIQLGSLLLEVVLASFIIDGKELFGLFVPTDDLIEVLIQEWQFLQLGSEHLEIWVKVCFKILIINYWKIAV